MTEAWMSVPDAWADGTRPRGMMAHAKGGELHRSAEKRPPGPPPRPIRPSVAGMLPGVCQERLQMPADGKTRSGLLGGMFRKASHATGQPPCRAQVPVFAGGHRGGPPGRRHPRRRHGRRLGPASAGREAGPERPARDPGIVAANGSWQAYYLVLYKHTIVFVFSFASPLPVGSRPGGRSHRTGSSTELGSRALGVPQN